MKALMDEMINWMNLYYGSCIFFVIAVFSYVYLFVNAKEARHKFLYPIAMVLFLILNPVLYKWVFSKIIYWRMFWMLPDGIIIAYAITKLVEQSKKIWEKLFVLLMFVCIVLHFGNNIYREGDFFKAENIQKVSAETKAVCDTMLAVTDNPKCIAPYELYSQIRQYSGDIKMLYGRNVDGYVYTADDICERIRWLLASDTPDYDYIFGIAVVRKYEFVITISNRPVDENILDKYGYCLLDIVENFNVYYNPDVEKNKIGGWVVTQYGMDIGWNSFYTIEDEEGNLIIIDGGYAWRSEDLRTIIENHDNHVTAWIITSVNEGHNEAFCEIMKNPGDIVVDNVYSAEVNEERLQQFKNSAKDWQNPGIFENYLSVIQNLNNVTFVKENDEINVNGLTINILHAWDEETDEIGEYYTHNGALCFTLQGNEEKMLFLSDLTQPMEKYIIRYGDELDVDYLQMNNHGEWGFSEQFIDVASPKMAFFDCWNSSMNPETTEFNSWWRYCYMVENGIKVYNYETAPNWIILK